MSPTTRRRPFAKPLALAVACGVAVRVIYIQFVAPHDVLFPDSGWYFWQAQNLRHGLGYVYSAKLGGVTSRKWFATPSRATAYWPPGYPIFLAVVQNLFGAAHRTSQLAGAATGAATIMLTGLLGRAIAGRSVGILAAFLVALNPLVIAADGSLMSETLYVPLVLLALLLAHRARMKSTTPAWCALGATIGVATLVRQDALLLVVFAAVPAAVLSRQPARDLVPKVALGLSALALVVGPWVVRNAIEIDAPTISTISSGAPGGANCKVTYSGREIGWWDYTCTHSKLLTEMSEAQYAKRTTRFGISYAVGHMNRLPVVMAARFGRTWGFWNPVNEARLEGVESRNFGWQLFAWPVCLCTLVLGLAGWRRLAAQGRQIAVLVAPAAMTTTITLVGYGNTRFRGPAECTLAIGAAAVIAGWIRRGYDGQRSSRAPDGESRSASDGQMERFALQRAAGVTDGGEDSVRVPVSARRRDRHRIIDRLAVRGQADRRGIRARRHVPVEDDLVEPGAEGTRASRRSNSSPLPVASVACSHGAWWAARRCCSWFSRR